jgi:hypothetical protein
MTTAQYDPELPFLADLERHVHARAEEVARARSKAPRRAHRSALRAGSSRELSPLAARMTRRTAILAGLLLMLGASAFGAGALLFNGDQQSPLANRQGASVVVARGPHGSEEWTLSLYTRNGELCRALIVTGQAEASRCAAAPAAGALGVSTLQSARHGYVFGVAGSRVRAVRVRVGTATLSVETHALTGQRAHAAGLPPVTRYYLALLPRALGGEASLASVTGVDPANHLIGRPHLACLQEAGPPPCGP